MCAAFDSARRLWQGAPALGLAQAVTGIRIDFYSPLHRGGQH
jgi:hypothetical protein